MSSRRGSRTRIASLGALVVAIVAAFVAVPVTASAFLPDGRIYEQVSPPNKQGNFVIPGPLVFTTGRGFAEAEGNGAMYAASGALQGASSSGEVQDVISRHVKGVGWETSQATPRKLGFLSLFSTGPKELVVQPSGDYSTVLFMSPAPYSPEEPSGPETSDKVYLSSNPLEAPLWLGKPEIENPIPLLGHNLDWENDSTTLYGITPDGSTAFFGAAGTLLPADTVREPNAGSGEGLGGPEAWGLYEAHNGIVSEAGELPNHTISPYGAKAASTAGSGCGYGHSFRKGETADNQVSEDGTRLFFVSPQPGSGAPEPSQLYVRELLPNGERKSVLASRDELIGGAPAPTGAAQWGNINSIAESGEEVCGTYAYGSPDGSHVIFATQRQLTSTGPTEVPYSFYPPGEGTMTFTAESATGSKSTTGSLPYNASSAAIQSALEGLSEIGTGNVVVAGPGGPYNEYTIDLHAATAVVLSGTSSVGEEGLNIQNGAPLHWYQFDVATETVSGLNGFAGPPVASSQDGSRVLFFEPRSATLELWHGGAEEGTETVVRFEGPEATEGAARASADGNVFEFQTRNEVPGFNDVGGFRQIFRYEVSSKELTCVSCPPRGVHPSGDAETPVDGYVFGGAELPQSLQTYRYMSADGHQLFFDSPDPLVGADVNGKRDVYEWDNGTVFLISSGTSTSGSYFFDISESGSDVFFTTEDGLVPSDKDEAVDVYDARIPHPGDFIPPKEVPCEGEVCQGPPSVPQLLTTPASGDFKGLGNIPPELLKGEETTSTPKSTCKKGFVKKNGKCVKKKKQKKKRKKSKNAKKSGHVKKSKGRGQR